MDDYLSRAYKFNCYVSELANWITQEGKEFLYTERLLECGNGIVGALNEAKDDPDCLQERYDTAILLLDEFSHLMELMVKTGVLTEIQSKPLLTDCFAIKEIVEKRRP